MSTLILVALICLVVGIAAGSLLTKTLHPREKQRRQLEEQLARARDEHKAYQQEVTEHFARTADLVGSLAQNFHAVHEQLANSAMQLATPEVSRKLMDAASRTGPSADGKHSFTIDAIQPEPPRDYAPKVPGGILSEHYGLEADTASRTARGQRDQPTPRAATLHPAPANGVGASPPSAPAPAQARPKEEEDEDPTLKVG